ncbi:MAG: bifunctional folylpolyglutamate synthase/dihydrofolate synthase [Eubacteriales bacterium]|nr:bifunctional folylpolyglutamate synthase/dihydrofolate synthase [Eubacteriales bacterium]MDD3882378.1 bifunctional folylpolyglutamate synthase/dihydrofolate synthase [Eubacteriales bacterium]MDD4512401.1 bifunctional folylpolyglutamate synthase/dihydrofolate synthase [Eubacteriales bacterium]
MTAEEAISYIHAGQYSGEKHGLDNTAEMLSRMGLDISKIPALHVAGTNGKGSVCAMAESCLRAEGYKTGLYTSPFLQVYNERIRINGKPVADELLISAAERMKEAADREPRLRLTAFEMGTICMFDIFLREKVDAMVLEVGMGGRLDPTNVVKPSVSVITAIGMDHMQYLGDTIEKIAGEKAGIIKENTPCVLHPCQPEVLSVVENACVSLNAPLYPVEPLPLLSLSERGDETEIFGKRIKIPLSGAHQLSNAACAVKALKLISLPVSDAAIVKGLESVVWPARLEWAGNILIDGAHNPQGAQSLSGFISSALAGRKIVLLTGIMKDKLVPQLVGILSSIAKCVIAVPVSTPRAASTGEIAEMFMASGKECEKAETLASGLETALLKAGDNGVVVCAGSLYLAGEMRSLLGLKP